MEDSKKELKEAFENFANFLHDYKQKEINQKGVQEPINFVYQLAKGDESNLLRYAVDNYFAVIKGCTKQREKEYLLFIKTIVDKMLEERR